MSLLIATALESVTLFFKQGGVFMVPLIALSILATTVIVWRARALLERNVLPPEIVDEVNALEPGDELTKLGEVLQRNNSPLARVLFTLIRNLSWPRADNSEAIQTQARHETARLETGMVLLEITAGIGPLIGLLGCLSGLVTMFSGLTNIGETDSIVIAHGIAEALNTTIVGISVAVPSLVAHNYFMRKIEVMAVEMEAVTTELLAKCYPSPDMQPSIQVEE